MNYEKQQRLLDVVGVCVRYDGHKVLNDVNITIDNIVRPGLNQGQVIALLGPSGIGKTQLFRCLAGLQTPTAGYVRFFDGEKMKPVSPGEVGVVQQSYPLLEHRSVLGNLQLVGDRKLAIDYLNKFGLLDKADKYPVQLSGGQRQRIAIIQQLLCSSHYLLMDEPFSGLDLLAKQQVCKTILGISTEHELNTIIVITHDIAAAMMIADTIWIIGRDRNDKNEIIPGAHIKHTIDLIERGIAWTDAPSKQSSYHATVEEIKDLFATL